MFSVFTLLRNDSQLVDGSSVCGKTAFCYGRKERIMYRSNRNFSRSNNRQNGGFRNRNNNQSRKRVGQSTFDPTAFVLQSQSQPQQAEEIVAYETKHQFDDFAISGNIKAAIRERGYTSPTPIQDQIIPHILNHRDVVGIANTGTGKTAAFLIPMIEKTLQSPHHKTLIIAPTRELAMQIKDELQAFTQEMRIYSALVIGGASMNTQIEALKRGPQFVIGTPGRIKDLNQRGKLRFDQFEAIVLDEVDRMLDMGFIHDVRKIISLLPQQRQSLFFSATMTDRVAEIMRGFLTDPIQVSVKTQETKSNIKQDIIRVENRSKVDLLHDLLITEAVEKVLVFGRTKRGTEKLSRTLQDRGFKVDAIHGNKTQGQRQRALKNFRENRISILIATDVVARGLDIDDVTHVINYDLPESFETYIHRIGRTGRANNTGTAWTFID